MSNDRINYDSDYSDYSDSDSDYSDSDSDYSDSHSDYSESDNVSKLKLKKSEIIKKVRTSIQGEFSEADYKEIYQVLYNQRDNNSIFEVILENNTNDRSKKFMINYFNFLKGKKNFIEKSNEIIVYFFNTRFIGSGENRKDIREISLKFIFDVLSSIYSSDSSYAIKILATFILKYSSQNHIEKIIKYGGNLNIYLIKELLYKDIETTRDFFDNLYQIYFDLTPKERDNDVYKKIFFPDEQKDNTELDNELSPLVLSLKEGIYKELRRLIFNIYDLYTSTIYNYTNIPNSPLLYLISKFYVMSNNFDRRYIKKVINILIDLHLERYIDIQDRNGNTPLIAALSFKENPSCSDIGHPLFQNFILYVFNLKEVDDYSVPEKKEIEYYTINIDHDCFKGDNNVYNIINRRLFPEQFRDGGKSRKRKSRRKRRRNKRKTRKAKKSGRRKSKKSRRRRRR